MRGQKIMSAGELNAARALARAEGRRVVQCHGCFDIVHPGHVRHLRFAKAQGDVLLVSITGDAQVGKGDGRPLIPQELRAENLAALDFVDWVVIEPGATAAELLERVRPDVYIKGREYEANDDPRFAAERGAVERHGGRVVFSSGDVIFSSTALIDTMERELDPFHRRLHDLMRRPELSEDALASALDAVRGRRILVVGETVLDEYVFCDRPEIAGESPVMTLRPIESRSYDGGAAVIARHAAALGAAPVLLTPLPDNEASERLIDRLKGEGVDVRPFPVQTRTPAKRRFLSGAQKLMKLDEVDPVVLDAAQRDAFVGLAGEIASETPDAAIAADFGLGLFTPALLGRLCETLRPAVRTLSGDVSGRRRPLCELRGVDLLCPSEDELRDAMQNPGDGLPAVTWELLRETGARAAIVTMGPDGLVAFDRIESDAPPEAWASRLHGEHVPALTPHALDALGCGDAMLAAATLALSGGASLLAGAFLGAASASVEARRLGNIPVSAAELRREIARVRGARLAYAPPELVRHTAPPGASVRALSEAS